MTLRFESEEECHRYLNAQRRIEDVLNAIPKPIVPTSTMNKTEAWFADWLEAEKHLKRILDWRFEEVKFVLAQNAKGGRNSVSYLPDFLVIHVGHFEFVEVKAKRGKWTSMRDDARAKINIAADRFPWFKFTVAYLEKGEWTFEKV